MPTPIAPVQKGKTSGHAAEAALPMQLISRKQRSIVAQGMEHRRCARQHDNKTPKLDLCLHFPIRALLGWPGRGGRQEQWQLGAKHPALTLHSSMLPEPLLTCTHSIFGIVIFKQGCRCMS
eukprot:1160176-Pelagomonas_calceolata.AAC.14